MNFRPVIAATTLIGTAALLATPAGAQVRQKAQPDHAPPARSSLLPQPPGKTAAPRATTSEEVPAPPPAPPLVAPALPFAAPAAPPRSAISR
jgi:hypothetical protein